MANLYRSARPIVIQERSVWGKGAIFVPSIVVSVIVSFFFIFFFGPPADGEN